jgi:hypothetical protein
MLPAVSAPGQVRIAERDPADAALGIGAELTKHLDPLLHAVRIGADIRRLCTCQQGHEQCRKQDYFAKYHDADLI